MRREVVLQILKDAVGMLEDGQVERATTFLKKNVSLLSKERSSRRKSYSPSTYNRHRNIGETHLLSPRKRRKEPLQISNPLPIVTFREANETTQVVRYSPSQHPKIIEPKPLSNPICKHVQSKRDHIENELIQTERAYVSDIRTLIQVFKRPLVERGIITPKQSETLFSIIEILLPVNEELLKKLERVKTLPESPAPFEPASELPNSHQTVLSIKIEQENTTKSILVDNTTTGQQAVDMALQRIAWDEERLLQLQSDYTYCTIMDEISRTACDVNQPILPQISFPPSISGRYPCVILNRSVKEVSNIGECFIQMGDFLKIYSTYCNNQEEATRLFLRLYEENDEFYNFTRECIKLEKVRNLELDAFLIMPLQRLCKYPLFIKQLLEVIPEDDPAHSSLEIALEIIQKSVSTIDSNKRAKEATDLKFNIQERIRGQSLQVQLFVPHRNLIAQGQATFEVKKEQKPCCVYIFTDFLLVLDGTEETKRAKIVLQSKSKDIVHVVNAQKNVSRIKILGKGPSNSIVAKQFVLNFKLKETRKLFTEWLLQNQIRIIQGTSNPKILKRTKSF